MSTLPVIKNWSSEGFPIDNITQNYGYLANDAVESQNIKSTISVPDLDNSSTEVLPITIYKINPIQLIYSKKNQEREQILRRYSGIVNSYNSNDEFFEATLVDEQNPNLPADIVEIFIAEIDEKDKDLVSNGAEFSWFFVRNQHKGRKKTFSEIKFRRLVARNAQELKNISLRTEELVSYFSTS